MKFAGSFKHSGLPLAFFLCRCLAGAGMIFFCLADAPEATARELARLQRVEVRQQAFSTRLDLKLDHATTYAVAELANRIRLTLKDTDGPRYRKFSNYNDLHISGIRFSQRGSDLQITIGTRNAIPRLRVVDLAAGVLTVNVGKEIGPPAVPAIVPGREQILKGTARLVTDFDPPLKAEIPFVPTDPAQLQKVAVDEEVKLFQRGESFLYKEMGADAAEIFTWFTGRDTPLRPLACYRLGEALYQLGRYDAALKAFREGEQRWPAYMAFNPAITFYFADSIARMGNLAQGRKMLARLISQLADKTYAPLLLDRLADILARNGCEKDAAAIFQTVVEGFPETEAANHALLKLADRRLFLLSADTYLPLAEQYRSIHRAAGAVSLRDDANFKAALVESLYGQAIKALAAVIQYEKQYPQGTFITIAHSIRQELLLQVYLEMYRTKDYQGLIDLARQNRDYLTRCFSDELFIHRLAEAFSHLQRPAGKVELFNHLAERDWTEGSAPFIYGQIVDTAMAMGDLAMADLTAANFLRRFPNNPDYRHMLEHRGEIAFLKKNLPGVVAELSWLAKPKEKAAQLNSYYYLGKALTAQKDYKSGERVLAQFIDGLSQSQTSSTFAADAYFTLGNARRGAGDYRGTMAAYAAGLEVAGGSMKEQFLFAMGEMELQMKNHREARSHWNRILKEGTDPVWRRMAEQGLNDLEWKEKMERLTR